MTIGSTGLPVSAVKFNTPPTFRLVVLPNSSTALLVRDVPVSSTDVVTVESSSYQTVSVHGVPARQLAIPGKHSSVTVTRSLADVDRSLSHLRWLLVFTCLGGIAVATLLGSLVSGRAIMPLRRLTETTERIAETGELSGRTGQRGRDEISRLSVQLDALLATLEQSIRTQRQLVADASHELRTPLATLRVNVGLLADPDGLDGDERAELVADLHEELESMTTLVTELVELAHGEELDVEPMEFRLDQVVRSAVDRAAKRTQAVVFRANLEPTTVLGLPERVERAVDNLLDNARKWSPAGETIDVSVRNGVVEVRDRGPGIAAEDAPLVFNRFYRSMKDRGTPGAGLGLAIVKQVADAHNGSVGVDQAPGGGAILRMSLLPPGCRSVGVPGGSS
ncbi:MAG TPA: HAMP domain-containing sensor histidine kinase [Gaiellaceae bacterium]|nr:HAMP domain-containing sensor histidine kinase [Gaiellaceae bacterium]